MYPLIKQLARPLPFVQSQAVLGVSWGCLHLLASHATEPGPMDLTAYYNLPV